MVLHLRGNAPDWTGANCTGSAPIRNPGESEIYDPWFDEEDPAPVMAICNGESGQPVCPIRDKCLQFALYNNEKYGVWGGVSEGDRKIMRRIWRWNSKMKEPHSAWRWKSHKEIQEALTEHIKAGKISRRELEEDDD